MIKCILLKTQNSLQPEESLQFFDRWISRKQPKMFNKMTKSWDKKTTRDLEQDCPLQNSFSLLIVVVKYNFTWNIKIISIRRLAFTLKLPNIEYQKKRLKIESF